ncbi:DNA-binding protein [Achromobacter sp. DMS1]|uniref:Zn-ribbon domain-containing OB-fold protein n=1 Tax=Achromobacter sp. DMS1 TaxID=1688405 RepID=UPI00069EB45B|nr:Zn-ribbon domain-containing OB-fold protein [Achromobacter sp. DMS1]KOF55377.1 DNA-binding protein [Achromobacter sp. DMS1]
MENESRDAGPQARYFAALARGRFEVQRCGDCDRHQFYPRTLCVHCGSLALQWAAPSGEGVVYSFSVVRRKPEAGGDYNVALVDLREGIRMMSRVEGVAPDDLHIGMPVRARVRDGEGGPLVVFDAQGVAA